MSYLYTDRTSPRDQFDRQQLADGIADLLLDHPRTSLPIAVGIFAPWGAGKTTFLGLIRNRIQQRDRLAKLVWFEPWRYEARQDVATGILARLAKEVRADPSTSPQLKRKARAAFGNVIAALPGAVLDVIEQRTSIPAKAVADSASRRAATRILDVQSEIDETLRLVRELLEEWTGEGRLVLFVDDLDRCLPDQMIQAMKAVHLFLGSVPCISILAVDRAALEAAIDARFGRRTDSIGKLYVDKIFHYSFVLPFIPRGIFQGRYSDSLRALRLDSGHLHPADIAFGNNPRQFERFLNHFLVSRRLADSRKLLEDEEDLRALVVACVLKVAFPDFFDDSLRYGSDALRKFWDLSRAGGTEVDVNPVLFAAGYGRFTRYASREHPVRQFINGLDQRWFELISSAGPHVSKALNIAAPVG